MKRDKVTMDTAKMRPVLVGLAAIAVGLAAMYFAGSINESALTPQERVEPAPLIEVTRAQPYLGGQLIRAPGRLRARQRLDVVAELSGKLDYVNPNFVMGGRLDEGEVLFRIDAVDFDANLVSAKAAVMSAEARLTEAQRTNDRQRDLSRRGASSESAKDRAVSDLAAAEAALVQARAQQQLAQAAVTRTVVKAPFPALVASETVSLGSFVSPGQVVGALLDTRAAELVASLKPAQAMALSKTVTLANRALTARAVPNSGSLGSATLTGYLDKISPEVDETSRTALAVALFPDAFAGLRGGDVFAQDFMTLEIETVPIANSFLLPVGCVRKRQFIWSVEGGKLVKQPVRVIGQADDQMVIVVGAPSLARAAVMVTTLALEQEGRAVRVAATPATTSDKR